MRFIDKNLSTLENTGFISFFLSLGLAFASMHGFLPESYAIAFFVICLWLSLFLMFLKFRRYKVGDKPRRFLLSAISDITILFMGVFAVLFLFLTLSITWNLLIG